MGVVKETSNVISFPLAWVFNLSINSGIVPHQLKIARVSPLYKSEELGIFTNYRPISILPAFTKILEKVIYNRLSNFLSKYNILSDSQYGFQKHHSTVYALTHLYDKISCSIDNMQFTVRIFIDLPKAFDTVDHNILLEKLEQFVESYGHCSKPSKIQCGVPRDLSLGPYFFLLKLMICVMYQMSWISFCLLMTHIFFPIVI